MPYIAQWRRETFSGKNPLFVPSMMLFENITASTQLGRANFLGVKLVQSVYWYEFVWQMRRRPWYSGRKSSNVTTVVRLECSIP